MKRTASYNEFGRHYDVVRCITGTIEIDDRRTPVLSANRSENSPSFGPEETALVSELMPHLQRALQIHPAGRCSGTRQQVDDRSRSPRARRPAR
jgi:hypothetical protein